MNHCDVEKDAGRVIPSGYMAVKERVKTVCSLPSSLPSPGYFKKWGNDPHGSIHNLLIVPSYISNNVFAMRRMVCMDGEPLYCKSSC